MKKAVLLSVFIFIVISCSTIKGTVTYKHADQAMGIAVKEIVNEYKKQTVSRYVNKIAVFPLVNDNGNENVGISKLGILTAYELQSKIINYVVFKKCSFIDRKQVFSVLQQHKINWNRIKDPGYVCSLKSVLDADLALAGIIHEHNDKFSITLGLYHIETGKLLADAEISFLAENHFKDEYDNTIDFQSGYIENSYRITIHEVEVTEREEGWDTQTKPDLYLQAYINNEMVLETENIQNKQKIYFEIPLEIVTREYDVVKILVYDYDLIGDNYIGGIKITPLKLNTLAVHKEYVTVKQGYIEKLKMKISLLPATP